MMFWLQSLIQNLPSRHLYGLYLIFNFWCILIKSYPKYNFACCFFAVEQNRFMPNYVVQNVKEV